MAKQKKCKVCKEPFTPRYSTLQSTCTNYKCVIEYNKKALDKKWEKRKAQMKEDLKPIGKYYEDLQKVINSIVRLIDNHQNCISCGSPPVGINAGHYYSVGANPAIRFHLNNIHVQCIHCNKHKSGAVTGYVNGLNDVYGSTYLNYVRSLKKSHTYLGLTKVEVKEKIAIARSIVRRLDSDIPNGLSKRLYLRKLINEELGIY